MPGSYTCQCEDGFALAVDKHSCYGTNNYSIYIACSAIIMMNDGIDSKLYSIVMAGYNKDTTDTYIINLY